MLQNSPAEGRIDLTTAPLAQVRAAMARIERTHQELLRQRHLDVNATPDYCQPKARRLLLAEFTMEDGPSSSRIPC
jgi:hypothetical protein